MVIEPIKTRRSTRKFKPTNISREQIQSMLEAAMLGPSACNTRPWRFFAITDRAVLTKLADAHDYAKMIHSAPLCIVIVALPKTQEGAQFDLPLGFYPQDCGAATQNIITQAEALGFGSCWCGVYPKEDKMKIVADILDIPADEVPFCLIAIGEKDEFPEPRGKYEEEKVTWI